ncbi:MAG: helix-turn-helix transcriptional regulator, partial [Candidatus Dormiibacterota bacterium]
MATTEGTPLATFAAEVRAYRQRLGWSQVVLGEKIGYSGSFVSDVERRERQPSLDFARACDREFGLPGTMVRLHELIQHNAYPAWFSPVIPLERKAVRIHGWQPFVVPGLLQTEDYARELIRVSRPQDSTAAVEELVTARMERQAILTDDDPPLLWYVLDEGILHRVVGSVETMDAQLERLITAASGGGTVIQVLSFSAGDQPGADGPITVYEFADTPTVCYTECYRGGRLVEDTSEVADMITTVSMARAAALS